MPTAPSAPLPAPDSYSTHWWVANFWYFGPRNPDAALYYNTCNGAVYYIEEGGTAKTYYSDGREWPYNETRGYQSYSSSPSPMHRAVEVKMCLDSTVVTSSDGYTKHHRLAFANVIPLAVT